MWPRARLILLPGWRTWAFGRPGPAHVRPASPDWRDFPDFDTHHSPAITPSMLRNWGCCLAYSTSRMKALPADSPEPTLRKANKVATSPETSLETQARWPLGEIISTGFVLSFMGNRKKLPFEVAFICQKVAPPEGTSWSYMFITWMSKGNEPNWSNTLR